MNSLVVKDSLGAMRAAGESKASCVTLNDFMYRGSVVLAYKSLLQRGPRLTEFQRWKSTTPLVSERANRRDGSSAVEIKTVRSAVGEMFVFSEGGRSRRACVRPGRDPTRKRR